MLAAIWRKIRFWLIVILALSIFAAGAYVGGWAVDKYHGVVDHPAVKWFMNK